VIEHHPLAGIIPMMDDVALETLTSDIATNGLHLPIVLLDEKILDGRNREIACENAGVAPRYETYQGVDPTAFVVSMNVERRHLTESQRAMIATRLATLGWGGDRSKASRDALTQDEVADRLKVGRSSVQRARKVEQSGDQELIDAVDKGVIPVNVAAELTTDSPKVRKSAIAHTKAGKKPQEAKRMARNEARADPEHKWPEGRYRVIYADPPWQYGSTPVDYQPAVSEHYPTLTVKEIAALPVKESTLDDAVLFLWVTAPILAESFAVVNAWGFTYKASFVWDKVLHNMGHYNSVRHELLLVCTRGACQPDVRTLFDSVYTEERTDHSRKPAWFREMIDTVYPTGPRIELFARETHEGWARHGYEMGLERVS
jgi:N6-adenosine-specific RNA methylase IME4